VPLDFYCKGVENTSAQNPAHRCVYVIAQPWKQPRGPSVGEWINIPNGILFSTKK
jgi:hypothetical protein